MWIVFNQTDTFRLQINFSTKDTSNSHFKKKSAIFNDKTMENGGIIHYQKETLLIYELRGTSSWGFTLVGYVPPMPLCLLSPALPPLYCMSVLTRKLLGQLGPLRKDKPNTPPANEYRIYWVKYNKRKHISKLSAIISLQLALPRNIKTIWFYIVSNTYYRQSRKTFDWTWQIEEPG